MNNKGNKELEELKKLMAEFEFSQNTLEAVIRREAADKEAQSKPIPDSGFGMYSQTAFEGYSLLIRAYLALYAPTLSNEQKLKLTSALDILETLRQQDLKFALSDTNSEPADKIAKKAYIISQLDSVGEVYIEGGFHGHHAIIKYTKHGDVYTRTEFNEGAGAEALSPKDSTSHVWGVNQRYASLEELTKAIDVDVNTIFSDKPASDQVTVLLRQGRGDESIRTTKQTVGNCSTRSTRALLRHVLGQPLLRDLFELATTPLDHTKDLIALQFYEAGVHLGNSSPPALLAELNKARTIPTPVPMPPVVFTEGMDVRNQVFSKLCDSIISQAEHILQGSLVKNDELDSFKKNLLNSLLAKRTTDTNSWAYLDQESWPEIAFILAKNLIDNGIISQTGAGNSLKISKPLTDEITVEGIGKCVATASGAEDQLGIDQALSECSRSLISTFTDQSSTISSVEKAKLISEIKKIILEVSQPYRIDDQMLKIIELQIYISMVKLGFPLTVPLTLKNLQSPLREEIIATTKPLLDQNDKLKPLKKTTLYREAKPNVGKLKIDKDKGISALLAKKRADDIYEMLAKPGEVPKDFLADALKFAIEYRNLDLVSRLREKGANIDAFDKFGRTYLMNAAMVANHENTQLVDFLIDAGAKADTINSAGKTALDLALENDTTAKIRLTFATTGGLAVTKKFNDAKKLAATTPTVPTLPTRSTPVMNVLPVPPKPSKEKLDAQRKEIEKSLPKKELPKIPPIPLSLKKPAPETVPPQGSHQGKKTPPPPPPLREEHGKHAEKLVEHAPATAHTAPKPSVSHTASVPGQRTNHRPPPPPPERTR